MGITYTTLKIRNFLTDSEIVDLEAKVDTGATMLVLPESTAAQFNFPKIRKQIVKYANEETAERDIIVGGLQIYPNPRSPSLPMAEIE